jgi:platelet-activating factor acetylhydrolase IB subunit alpha
MALMLQRKIITLESLPSGRDLPNQKHFKEMLGHRGSVTKIAFHPNQKTLASGNFLSLTSASEDGTVKIWDSETGEFIQTVKGHIRAVTDVIFNRDGSLLGNPVNNLKFLLVLIRPLKYIMFLRTIRA